MKKLYFFLFLTFPCVVFGQDELATHAVVRDCKVNLDIQRQDVPATPDQMSLPQFGQEIIGWGTGPKGAQKKITTLTQDDIRNYQVQGVDLLMIKGWYDFYVNETSRNPCNPTAPLRAELMYKIMQLWR